MNRFWQKVIDCAQAFLLVALTVGFIACIAMLWFGSFSARADDAPMTGQYLMVDQHGNIVPQGYTLGLDQIASIAASQAAASNRTLAVQEATASARGVVSNLTEVLVGNNSFGYIDGFTVSFGGTAAVSSNATCQIVKLEINAWNNGGLTNINNTACAGHYIYFYYSEPMNSTPYIRWKRALGAEWEIVPCQDIVAYPDGTTLDGQPYSNLYRATVYIDATLSSAFFLAYCEISEADGDGSVMNIQGGITISGSAGFTGTIQRTGADTVTYDFVYKGGLLMSVSESE